MQPRELTKKNTLWRLIGRLLVYYGVFVALVFATAIWAPGFFKTLPFGGVTDIEGQGPMILELEDALLNADEEDIEELSSSVALDASRYDDAWKLFTGMLGALLMMLPVSWVYRAIHVGTEHDRSMDETVLLLPPVVAGVVLVFQHSLALAFSLAGIVAAVRFRRALTDTIDALFIFVAVGVGIAAGIGALGVALVLSAFFCFSASGTCLRGDGLESQYQMRRKREKKRRKLEQAQRPDPPASGSA